MLIIIMKDDMRDQTHWLCEYELFEGDDTSAALAAMLPAVQAATRVKLLEIGHKYRRAPEGGALWMQPDELWNRAGEEFDHIDWSQWATHGIAGDSANDFLIKALEFGALLDLPAFEEPE